MVERKPKVEERTSGNALTCKNPFTYRITLTMAYMSVLRRGEDVAGENLYLWKAKPYGSWIYAVMKEFPLS